MEDSDATRMTHLALLFEGGLAVVALALGWLVGQWPLMGISAHAEEMPQQVRAVGWGLVATGPLVVALVLMERFPIGPLLRLQQLTSQVILRMFGGASILQLAAVALAAGVGEELLFRRLLQAGAERFFGLTAGIIVSSVLFGVCHWLNTAYAILAMLAGVYFGLCLVASGNILTPIVAHAVYDFLALVYLVRPEGLLGSKSE